LLTDGIAAVLENNTVYSTLRGDILIFRPDEVHFGRILRPGFHEYIDIFIPINYFDIFLPDFSSLLFPFEDRSDDRINCISPSDDAKMKVLEIAENIRDIYSSENPAKEIFLFSYLIGLLKLCGEQYGCRAKSIYNENVPAVISRAVSFINEKYQDTMEMNEIAAYVGCSTSYLARMFRKYIGKTVHNYITDCRIRCAKKHLREGSSVTDACYKSGFGDCSNFIKVFKKNCGNTPCQYRKQNSAKKLSCL
jgi:AraC-like DNA-binding protein